MYSQYKQQHVHIYIFSPVSIKSLSWLKLFSPKDLASNLNVEIEPSYKMWCEKATRKKNKQHQKYTQVCCFVELEVVLVVSSIER